MAYFASRTAGIFVLLTSMFFVSGCGGDSAGPKVGTMTGKITYKGAPLSNGTVQVFSADGRGGSGPITADGTYTALGDVTITVKVLASAMTGMKPVARPPGTPAMPGESDKPPVTIPANYGDKAKSGLTFTIKSGTQTNNIDLK
ncbi:MAG: hypothetical protein EBS30_12185 [Planctomycetes bacterium]|nr:hypothetical protein [Planctomycetota bacterium]